jgi:hypothetical protein
MNNAKRRKEAQVLDFPKHCVGFICKFNEALQYFTLSRSSFIQIEKMNSIGEEK